MIISLFKAYVFMKIKFKKEFKYFASLKFKYD